MINHFKADERIDIYTNSGEYQNRLHLQRYQFALAQVKPGAKVLEIGTGLGVFSEMLVSKGIQYHGIEYDADACLASQKRVGSDKLIQRGDAQSLNFSDCSFDCVICLEVLEHLPYFRQAVSEAARVTKNGGKYIASVPYCRKGGPSKTNPHHLYEPGEKELLSCLKKNFSNVDIYYQRYMERWFMTLARILHIRRFTGLVRPYRDLHAGQKEQLIKIQLDSNRQGLLLGLMLICTR